MINHKLNVQSAPVVVPLFPPLACEVAGSMGNAEFDVLSCYYHALMLLCFSYVFAFFIEPMIN